MDTSLESTDRAHRFEESPMLTLVRVAALASRRVVELSSEPQAKNVTPTGSQAMTDIPKADNDLASPRRADAEWQ